ncbi:MAG TPA: LCP family protein [Euzebya sp.]|nr:LCP family protein [Euzebya sp.]
MSAGPQNTTPAPRSRHRTALRLGTLLLTAVLGASSVGALSALALDGLAFSGSHRVGYSSDDLLVVLAIGSDLGPPLRPGDPTRGLADGIHLFVVDTTTDRMTVVDIPRDSAIGGGKVNSHLAHGGPEQLEAQLEAWTGLAIDFWVLGSFQSVEAVTHDLGGITIDVPQRLLDPYSGTDLHPGPQTLDPGQALGFTRNRRSLGDGDIGRSANQTRLMLAALGQVRGAAEGNLHYVVNVVATLRQHTASNIPPGQMLTLALTALRIQPENIAHVTISGPFSTIGRGSVILPQPGDLFQRLSEGQVGPAQ